MLITRYVPNYALQCDRCRAPSTGFASRELLFAWARTEGWRVEVGTSGTTATATCASCARSAGAVPGVFTAVKPRGAQGRRAGVPA